MKDIVVNILKTIYNFSPENLMFLTAKYAMVCFSSS